MWYDTGTVAVTNGSTTVTGTGTDFISGAQVGEAFLAPDDKLYEIQSITSATVLVLADPYLGSTQSGQDYKIVPTQSLVADLASQVTDLITDYSDVKDTAGAGKFNDGTVTAPAITFEQDQNNGLYRIGNDNYAMSAGGTKQIDISTTDVELNYSGSKKLATTSTGVDVTGTITADSLTVDGDVEVLSGTLLRTTNAGVTNPSLAPNLLRFEDNDPTKINNQVTGAIDWYSNDNDGTGVGAYINGYTNNTGGGYLTFGTGVAGTPLPRLTLSVNGDVHLYEDTGTTPKFVWDSSAESLGIGTSSFAGLSGTARSVLLVDGASSSIIGMRHGGTGDFYFQNDAAAAYSWSAANKPMVFGVNNAERARIDSSGTLLVGTTQTPATLITTSTTSHAGVGIADGYLSIARDLTGSSGSGGVAFFNRLATDGPIADFRKDGSTVGSIRSKVGTMLIGTGNTGIVFTDTGNSLRPRTMTDTTSDGVISLGQSGDRFKDLYLSGGVYLGGTGSDNKLDDYETGTFTPAFSGAGLSITYDGQVGYYVKVGNAVHFRIQLGTDSVSGGSPTTNLTIGGLPFTPNNYATSGSIGFCYGTTENINNARWLVTTGSSLTLYTNSTTESFENVHTDALGTATNNNRLYVSGTYFTDS